MTTPAQNEGVSYYDLNGRNHARSYGERWVWKSGCININSSFSNVCSIKTLMQKTFFKKFCQPIPLQTSEIFLSDTDDGDATCSYGENWVWIRGRIIFKCTHWKNGTPRNLVQGSKWPKLVIKSSSTNVKNLVDKLIEEIKNAVTRRHQFEYRDASLLKAFLVTISSAAIWSKDKSRKLLKQILLHKCNRFDSYILFKNQTCTYQVTRFRITTWIWKKIKIWTVQCFSILMHGSKPFFLYE